MKDGARREEQNEIKRRAAEGHTAEEISSSMRITVRCVKAFMGEESEDSNDDSTDDALDSKTKDQLKEMLDEAGIEYGSGDSKAELIDLLEG